MRILFSCSLILALGFFSSLHAQDIYLKATAVDGVIMGESMDKTYRDQVVVQSYAQGSAGNCSSGSSGAPSCQITTGNLFFTMNVDKSLNPFRRNMYAGRPLPRVDVTFVKMVAGIPTVYYVLRLEEALVASISESVSGSNTVQLELKPQKIGWTYTPIGPDGRQQTPVKFGWDILMNAEWMF